MKALIAFMALVCSIALGQAKPGTVPQLTLRPTRTTVIHSERLMPVPLPHGKMLFATDDTVYVLDSSGSIAWKYVTHNENEVLTAEPAYNPETNEVGMVGTDLFSVRIDADTGKVKWEGSANGRAGYADIKPYRQGFLVVIDMSGYRENNPPGYTHLSETDALEYWGKSNDDFWSIDFPRNSDLVIIGSRIYAMRRVRNSITLRELRVPSGRSPR